MSAISVPVEKPGRKRSLLWAGLLLAILTAGAAGGYLWYFQNLPSCEVSEVQEASAMLVSQVNRYDQVYMPAASAPPHGVVYPLTVLQQVLVDTQAIEVPACLQAAKDELLGYMGTVIRAFQAYAAGESDATVRNILSDSYAHINNFIAELEAVEQCAPTCPQGWRIDR
jgi:hypothetical protein